MAIPTATDKVILIDFTLPETNVFLLTEYETNQQFSTLDVGSAFIGFKAPTETGLDGMTVKISLVNLDDDSFVNHTETIATATNHVALDNVYYYQVRRAELERQGKWIGRVSFVDNNGKTWGTRKFTFLIDGDILGVKRTKLHAIDSVEDFMEDMSALMLDFNGFITQMETNESDRGTTFTTTMTDFTDLFNQAQQLRADAFNQAQAGRTGDFNASELSRTQTFDTSEASRTTTFNASETSRGNTFTQNENARIGTFTQNENARQAEFDLGESTRNDGFDADHTRAVTDHTTNLADHSTALTDHSTATADHTRAVTDHTTNLADHAIVGGYNTRLQAEETATANNKISAVKSKTFTDVDSRIEDVEFDTTMMATNLVTNGDFSNGTTSWATSGLTNVSVTNNTLTYNSPVGSTVPSQSANIIGGNKYYARIYAKSKDKCYLRVAYTEITRFHSAIDQFEVLSAVGIGLITATGNISYRTEVGHVTTDSVSISQMVLIDLTATFGAGKEPTVEQMDEIMSKFTNSWFDGTKNLFRASETLNTIRNLYTDKANKVQEAWITPTLLNGATGTVQYRKNEFGRVEFKGLISGVAGPALITMPAGYRPIDTAMFTCRNGATNTSNIQIQAAGGLYLEYPSSETQGAYMHSVSYATN